MNKISQNANKMALNQVNLNRKKLNLKPLRRLSSLWWAKYRDEWIEKAKNKKG
jgi:hypothetical protein